MFTKWDKAIVAGIALILAVARGAGWEIPEGTENQIYSLLIVVGGTFGVYQVANKE